MLMFTEVFRIGVCKMNDSLLNLLAVRILEVWFLLLGFQPSDDWDADDPACLQDYGRYRIITVQAHIPDDCMMDEWDMFHSLRDYLDHLSILPDGLRFCAYEVNEYQSTHFGRFVYASICHTA